MDELEMLQLHAQFGEEMKALIESGAGLPFLFSPAEAFMLLSALQLVLRHPALLAGGSAHAGPLPEFLRDLALNIQGRLCVTPAIRRVAELGWDTTADTTPVVTCEYEA